ncbi:MAG TPA: hypothetical protein VF266_14115 [Thermoanaerobaculia bacterium]
MQPEGFSKKSKAIGEYEDEKHGFSLVHHHDPSGVVRADLYRASIRDFNAVRNGTFAHLGLGQTWDQNGPGPAQVNASLSGNGQMPGPNTGAVMDLAIDPAGQIAYAVFNDGGVWKTTDGGDSWTPTTDSLDTLSFGAVVISPANSQVLYAGSGNYFNNGYFKGLGIYQSTDGAGSWTLLPASSIFNGVAILKMVMLSSDLLLVSAIDPANQHTGLYRSSDGGVSFSAITIGGSSNIVSDLRTLPGDANKVWAGVSGQGVFYSSDQGQTFTNLWTASNGAPASGTYNFVSVAFSTDTQTIYAVVTWNPDAARQNNSNAGFFKSTDGGSNWSYLAFPAMPAGFPEWRYLTRSQGGYDQTLGVDPGNASRVYMGFQDLWVSEDGGTTWRDATFADSTYRTELMHVDHHAMVIVPAATAGDPPTMWVGNDGGIWKSSDHGTTWVNRNGQVATNLFRAIDTGRGAGNVDRTYGGMQDTGTAAGLRQPGSSSWNEFGGGDGGAVAVDPTDANYAYGTWGSVIATTDGGATVQWPTVSCTDPSASAGGFSDLAAGADRKVYLAGQCSGSSVMFQKATLTGAFTQIFTTPDSVNRIGLTAADTNLVWLGLNNGSLVKATCDSAGTWTTTTVTIPNVATSPASVAVNPANANQVVAVFSGYSGVQLPQPSQHVFLSNDGGTTWTDISGVRSDARVPDMPIYSAAIDPHTHAIVVATDLGILRTYDSGASWHTLSSGYPNVHTTSLALDATTNPSVLKAGTFGRSTWLFSMSLGEEVFPPLSRKDWNVGNVNWTNNSSEPLTLSWIDHDGNEIAFATLAPNSSTTYGPAYFVGVNPVRDADGNLVLVYVINETQTQDVTISADAVAKAKTNAMKALPGFQSLPNMAAVAGNLSVTNQTNVDLTICWYDSNAQPQTIGTLSAGQSTPVGPVYFGGMFAFQDSTGNIIEMYVVTDLSTKALTITQAAVDFWT